MRPVLLPAGDPTSINTACEALRRGDIIGIPTETVYGLAADAGNPDAVARIFAAKGRPNFNPLISHVASLAVARQEAHLDERAERLASAFWPGPLTIVAPVRDTARTCDLSRAGLETIGLRMPRHPLTEALLAEFGGPIAAPSANPSGRLSPTRAMDVAGELGDAVSVILDGGECPAGIESTIVSVLPDEPVRLLRPGAIDRLQVAALVGPLGQATPNTISAPGQLSSHYAPRAAIRMNATEARDHEVLLGFGPDAAGAAANLSESGDTVEAAARLYRLLRELDATGADTIAVMPIPADGLGEAINDRLRRAAAPRAEPGLAARPLAE